MLKTEMNTTEMAQEILNAAEENYLVFNAHVSLVPFFEHGQWWITCNECGASWSVNDAEKDGEFYFDFEAIDAGDEYCYYQ